MGGAGRRTVQVTGLVVGVVTALTLVVAAAGGPTREDGGVRVLQMNLCDSGLARCYTGRSVSQASDVIRAEVPDAVSYTHLTLPTILRV